jgi:CheY-like chemotaxis protein
MMKFHPVNSQSPLSRVFLQVFGSFRSEQAIETPTPDDAELLLLVGCGELRTLHWRYGDTKFFAVLSMARSEWDTRQPSNVFIMNATDLINGDRSAGAMLDRFSAWQAARVEAPHKPARTLPADIPKFARRYAVLVVDDAAENLELAKALLTAHDVTVARCLEDALKIAGDARFDAVLSDMNMRPDKTYPALNLDRYGVEETEAVGVSAVFEMTKRGVPVAIVTDANHHQDWFSAMFDVVKEANVNGQRVIFRNSGKRWDRALKQLMEP